MTTETGEVAQVAVETFPKKKTFWQREWVVAAVFLAPFMILFLVFRVYPIIQAVTLSFDNVESIGQSEFIGLGNYQELASDERFLDAVGNNALYTHRHPSPADPDPAGVGRPALFRPGQSIRRLQDRPLRPPCWPGWWWWRRCSSCC